MFIFVSIYLFYPLSLYLYIYIKYYNPELLIRVQRYVASLQTEFVPHAHHAVLMALHIQPVCHEKI